MATKAKPAPKPPGKVRSATTGRYVPPDQAKKNPGGTVTEHDKPKKK